MTQEVIPLHGGDEHLTDGEGDEDEASDGDVDQDVVERDAQLLVLDRHEENNKVKRCSSEQDEAHEDSL